VQKSRIGENRACASAVRRADWAGMPSILTEISFLEQIRPDEKI